MPSRTTTSRTKRRQWERTTIEADSIDELFGAAQAAHEAVDGDRVSTFLKIDDKRSSDETAVEKVRAVESKLGRAARSGVDTLEP